MKTSLSQKLIATLVIVFLCTLLAVPIASNAADAATPKDISADITAGLEAFNIGAGLSKGTGATPLKTTIGNVIGVLLGFLGIVMVVLIIYGGFLWMTAGGDEAKVTKAKTIIRNAIIGIVIILAAYIITGFVIEQFGTATGTGGAAADPAID